MPSTVWSSIVSRLGGNKRAAEEEEDARPAKSRKTKEPSKASYAVTPRQLGYTRDGGVIRRYEPSPDPSIPRPSYVPLHLHDVASFVEIEYPDSGVARVWRVPRGDEE
jgi:hypothetical protein